MDKVLYRDMRKMGACSEGLNTFKRYFPHGAQFTYDDALKAVKEVPMSFVYWWIEHTMGVKVAERFYAVLDKASDRAYTVSDWEKEDKRLARWLLKTAQKHLQGGDVSISK